MDKKKIQVVETSVTKKKFDAEIAAFRAIEETWRKKGVVCLASTFPTVEFLFTALNIRPHFVLFGVSIDFTNYDLIPPSIVFIDPFSFSPLNNDQVGLQFYQIISIPQQLPNGAFTMAQQRQPILMNGADQKPFLCIPGVKEYHEHPAHSNDPWLERRKSGEGSLCFLLDQLYNHSVPYVTGINFNLNIAIAGIKQFQ